MVDFCVAKFAPRPSVELAAETALIVPLSTYPGRLGLLIISGVDVRCSLPSARQLAGERWSENAIRLLNDLHGIRCNPMVSLLMVAPDGDIDLMVGLALPTLGHGYIPLRSPCKLITEPEEADDPRHTAAIRMFFAGAPG